MIRLEGFFLSKGLFSTLETDPTFKFSSVHHGSEHDVIVEPQAPC